MTWRWMLPWVLCFAAACSEESPADDSDDASDSGDEDIEPRVGGTFAGVKPTVCPTTRQIVYRTTTGACVAVASAGGGWNGTKMFPGWAGDYAKYCAYDFLGAGAPLAGDIAALTGKPWVHEAAPDCMVVQPSSTIAESVNPELHDLLVAHADLLTDTELGLPGTEAGRAPVRVAVVDTTPEPNPGDARDDHGIIVAEIIEEVSHGCESAGACKVLVQNVLGLPRYGLSKGATDPVNGGYVASHSELANGMYNAIRDWELLPVSPMSPKPKLIINLSVAWLSTFGGDPASAPPAVDALLLAMRRASCEGALIVAAAGNEQNDCASGPMVPALWEQITAPSVADCIGLYNVPAPAAQAAAPAYQPLVHSVGGLDIEDDAVSVSRVGGRPRMAALADHVVGVDTSFSARTGTSMSAAVVSGIAALVWSYRPTLTSQQLADVIWTSGYDTGDDADYPVPGPAIRRSTACNALTDACALAGGGCPGAFSFVCTSGQPDTTAIETTLTTLVEDVLLAVQIRTPSFGQCGRYCGETEETWFENSLPQACPAVTGPAKTDIWTSPQPTNPGCSTCYWKSTGSVANGNYSVSVYGTLSEKYATPDDTSVTVHLTMDDGTVSNYELGYVNLTTTDVKQLRISPSPTKTVVSGTIDIVFAPGSLPVTGDLSRTFF